MNGKLYLHPKTNVVDAAIDAFENGARLATKAGRVSVEPGRDVNQYEKALKAKALAALARTIRLAHNS